MVDTPGAGGTANSVAVRTITQAGGVVWVGGVFDQIDDPNGNKVADANGLAPFGASTGALATGIHIPIFSSSTSTPPEVYGSSLGPDGHLYLSGRFDGVDGQKRHNVAAIDPATGNVLPFAPDAGDTGWSIFATADAIYVGTGKLLSFQPNGTATPGYGPPTAFVDPNLRAHTNNGAFRDIEISGNTLVSACVCDSLSDANGTRNVKAIVEIDAASGNWINWAPKNLCDYPSSASTCDNGVSESNRSAAFGIHAIIHNDPVTNKPVIYLAAGGSDFATAYPVAAGGADGLAAPLWSTDTSGSSQAINWYQSSLIVGGHFDYTESPSTSQCGSNASPTPGCYYSPKLVAMDPSNGHVLLDPNTNKPWNPGICCRYNGVWSVMVASDGSTLNVGGEFDKAGGTWACQSYKPTCLSGSKKALNYARFGGSAPTTETLSVSKAGSGSGTVSDNTGAIDCGSTCTAQYASGTSVTLTATPDGSSTFTGWSSSDSGFSCPGTGTCTVTMDRARTVTATFAAVVTNYTLSVQKAGTGSGTVSDNTGAIDCGSTCTAQYASGTSVTLTATPDGSSTFTGWSSSNSGFSCPGSGTCTVTMDRARTVTATFAAVVTTYTLSVQKAGTGSGMVTDNTGAIDCGSTCTAQYASGTSVTLTATPGSSSTFTGWSSSDSGFSCAGTGTCTVTMDRARTVTATFAAVVTNYTLSVQKAGTGSGTVTDNTGAIDCGSSCTAQYASGTIVTLTATPDGSSTFTGWSSTDRHFDCPGTVTCTVTMNRARTVTATFTAAITTETLNVSLAGSGSGKVSDYSGAIDCGSSCTAQYPKGTDVTLLATPSGSSTFSGWSSPDAGFSCPGTGACTVTMSRSWDVTATFATPSTSVTIDDTDPSIAYNGWSAKANGSASDGAYEDSRTKGDMAIWTSPADKSFTWFAHVGPHQGIASVTIDGDKMRSVDLYSPTPGTFSKRYWGLTDQPHKVIISVTGKKDAPSKGKGVSVDAFRAAGTIYQESDSSVRYDDWRGKTDSGAHGGSYRASGSIGSTATVKFSGTAIDWITTTGDSCGKALVTIDGRSMGTISLYSPSEVWQQAFSFKRLGSGRHIMEIEVLGRKALASSGTKVVVDGFTIHS